jgi:two-component system, NtrC family, response regulator AtoC
MTRLSAAPTPPTTGAHQWVPAIRQDLVAAIESDARVLLTGRSAAGAKAVARLIHRHGARAGEPFLTINCGRRPDLALEGRLFGRARDPFDGPDGSTRGLLEQAHGGTIFIANIGAIGRALQNRLLQFLRHGEVRRVNADVAHATVDVRVIAAADLQLFEQIEAGTFSGDLYYRLNVMHLVMPDVVPRRR